jgi:single-strand DNA-binding protein
VAIDGRLDWREYQAQDGTKREAIEIVADSVQFLGGRQDAEGGQPQFVPSGAQADSADLGSSAADDDIPF